MMTDSESVQEDGQREPEPAAAADATDAVDASAAEPTDAPTDDAGRLRKEAARYRRQVRDVEAERDGLRDRLQAMQRREVERMVAPDLAAPADIWLTGVALPDLLDDGGDVDAAKVSETVKRIVVDRPTWRRATVANFDGGVRASMPTQATFQDVLRGGKR